MAKVGFSALDTLINPRFPKPAIEVFLYIESATAGTWSRILEHACYVDNQRIRVA
jgi:hypothetical protein